MILFHLLRWVLRLVRHRTCVVVTTCVSGVRVSGTWILILTTVTRCLSARVIRIWKVKRATRSIWAIVCSVWSSMWMFLCVTHLETMVLSGWAVWSVKAVRTSPEDIMLPKVHCTARTKISVRTVIQVWAFMLTGMLLPILVSIWMVMVATLILRVRPKDYIIMDGALLCMAAFSILSHWKYAPVWMPEEVLLTLACRVRDRVTITIAWVWTVHSSKIVLR